MQKASLFPKLQSAQLRHNLESRLTAMFTQGVICRYLSADSCDTHALLSNGGVQSEAYPQLRLAYSIWLGMQAADRHAVLAKFQSLCALLPKRGEGRKTMAFCSVFIYEFIGILAETMDWPD